MGLTNDMRHYIIHSILHKLNILDCEHGEVRGEEQEGWQWLEGEG